MGFMKKQQGFQPLDFSGGLVDIECFLAWSERIKLDMSKSNPLLYEVLGRLASSKHPIAGGESFQTESAEASFLQGMSHQHSGADKEKEARELQISSEGRQLGCLLVQRTKGETQLKVTKWLVATNGWEAWRQLNLSFLSRLLNSLLHTSFDEYTSFLLATTLCLEGACGDLSRAFWRTASRISHDFCCFEWLERENKALSASSS